MTPKLKAHLSQARHIRVRKKIVGTSFRPRMSVKFTNKNIYVQFIDDEAGHTLASINSVADRIKDKFKTTNIINSKYIGEKAAKAALSVGIQHVVFDRGSKMYHGRIKALADSAREAGLKF